MKVLPFDQGLPESLITCTSSLEYLPFDSRPDQLLTLHQADNPILCQVTKACSFCISDSVFFFAFQMMGLSFVWMFWQMFDKIFARIRFLFVLKRCAQDFESASNGECQNCLYVYIIAFVVQ